LAAAVIDYVDDFEEDEIAKKAREELAHTIPATCWAGDGAFEGRGFRHIGARERATDDDDSGTGVDRDDAGIVAGRDPLLLVSALVALTGL
jgi:hypothetical protein